MYETYAWTDPRIHVNHSHHFWKGRNEKSKNTIRLFGLFVERCLWTPRLNFLNAVEDSESNTNTLSSSSNPNMEPYLSSYPKRDPHPRIVISSLQMKVHINCNMRFDRFPFDEQVIQILTKLFCIRISFDFYIKFKFLECFSLCVNYRFVRSEEFLYLHFIIMMRKSIGKSRAD